MGENQQDSFAVINVKLTFLAQELNEIKKDQHALKSQLEDIKMLANKTSQEVNLSKRTIQVLLWFAGAGAAVIAFVLNMYQHVARLWGG